jgi:hypothetical protein
MQWLHPLVAKTARRGCLVLARPLLPDRTVATWTYNVGAPHMEGEYTTPAINCSAYGRGQTFYTVVSHSQDGDMKGDKFRPCG